jgi:hypothetical protein
MTSGLPPLTPVPAGPSVRYWAVSLFQSRTFWLNAVVLVVAVLSATEVLAIVPIRLMPTYVAVLAALNIFLRTQTVRPVAIIPLGAVRPVEVKRVGPPPPPALTD